MDNTIWMPYEEYLARKEFYKKLNEDFAKAIWGKYTPKEPKLEDNVKIAWVIKDGNRKMIGVDNKTMQGYKLEKTIPVVKIPLEDENYDSFERWCTLMDM